MALKQSIIINADKEMLGLWWGPGLSSCQGQKCSPAGGQGHICETNGNKSQMRLRSVNHTR